MNLTVLLVLYNSFAVFIDGGRRDLPIKHYTEMDSIWAQYRMFSKPLHYVST